VLAAPFDISRLEPKSAFVPVIEGVRRFNLYTQLSVSDRGSLIYISGDDNSTGAARNVLALAERSGKIQTLPLPPGAYEYPRISPVDGKWLAFGTNDSNEQTVSLYDLSETKSPRRLTFGGNSSVPVWSRDGRYIYFRSDRDGKLGLFRQSADGTGSAERLSEAEPTDERHYPLSSDGKVLTYELRRGAGDSDIWMLPLDGDRKPKPLFVQPNFQSHAVFSPSGRWMAYMSNELSGFMPEIFVQPFPPTKAKYQLTTDGGGEPLWSPDGKQLFYYWNSKLLAIDVQTEPSVSFGKPSPLPITGALQQLGLPRNYDITPDGKQFIIVLAASQGQNNQPATPQINVVLNWVEELKQRVPAH
jgi:Tol biopolymer transport system component